MFHAHPAQSALGGPQERKRQRRLAMEAADGTSW
jgi:hypothetical protein